MRLEEGRAIGFREAALELCDAGQSSLQRLPDPDFSAWDLQDMEQLKQLAWSMVIHVTQQHMPVPPCSTAAIPQDPHAPVL